MERTNIGKTELPISYKEKLKTFFNFFFHSKEDQEPPISSKSLTSLEKVLFVPVESCSRTF